MLNGLVLARQQLLLLLLLLRLLWLLWLLWLVKLLLCLIVIDVHLLFFKVPLHKAAFYLLLLSLLWPTQAPSNRLVWLRNEREGSEPDDLSGSWACFSGGLF
jgi:hypothetical protein